VKWGVPAGHLARRRGPSGGVEGAGGGTHCFLAVPPRCGGIRVLAMKSVVTPPGRENNRGVPRSTRRNIVDGLRIEGVRWSGVLDDLDFLERIFDLSALPSHDNRFPNAAGDVWQHRINNDDWEDDWVYSDPRLDLVGCPTPTFLQFLCEMVHPVVRPDTEEAMKLVGHFNDQLRQEGWELCEAARMAGRPCFVARRYRPGQDRAIARAQATARSLSAGWMKEEVERIEGAIEKDPALAIGTAKDLIESCCKSVLLERGIEAGRKANLPQLAKRTAGELKLVPEGIPDTAKGADNIRRVLQNLAALVHHLAELRGLYGSGHGRDGKYRGLQPRHARLAVGAAVAFVDFVTETHAERTTTEPAS